jgi:hypothetical protein
LLPDNHIELIFDEQKEELLRRNREVAQLLKEQRDDLVFLESVKQKSDSCGPVQNKSDLDGSGKPKSNSDGSQHKMKRDSAPENKPVGVLPLKTKRHVTEEKLPFSKPSQLVRPVVVDPLMEQRKDSLSLNQEIDAALRIFATHSAAELLAAHDEIRKLREELKVMASEAGGKAAAELLAAQDEIRVVREELRVMTSQKTAMEKRLEKALQTDKCVVCKKEKKDHAMVPCGHFCLCRY